jgi:hypothetical protein
MESNGFTGESRFYRYTLPEFLEPLEEPGMFLISANEDPSESVINVYEDDHFWLAAQIGSGLAFAETADNEWKATDRIGIEVRLQDALDQGGLIYPVQSIITERVWYFTLPSGSVRVRKLG